ncbi:uncharacterized protein VTP21DRAFT_7879 [Calcarisporiella thermophila]|uniref:uncharacterized protein n=1 Tax=Calcarisporiella thermophila TaxID=911321 RepID=UPI00374443ED
MKVPGSALELYDLFIALEASMPSSSEFTHLLSTLLIPREAMPTPEAISQVKPYLAHSPESLSKLLIKTLEFCAEDSQEGYSSMFSRICESLFLLQKVEEKVGRGLLEKYVAALRLDDSGASHEDVMKGVEDFLNSINEEDAVKVRKIMAEEEAAEELGLTEEDFANAASILNSDTLYVEVLSLLHLNHTQNLPWQTVLLRIEQLVNEKKPEVWPSLRAFLERYHLEGYMRSESEDEDLEEMTYEEYCEKFLVGDMEMEQFKIPEEQQPSATKTQAIVHG